MAVKPIITVKLANGKKVKYECYNRPPVLYLNLDYGGGMKQSVPFERTGPDEYEQLVKKSS